MYLGMLVTWPQVGLLFLGWLLYLWGYRRGSKDAVTKAMKTIHDKEKLEVDFLI